MQVCKLASVRKLLRWLPPWLTGVAGFLIILSIPLPYFLEATRGPDAFDYTKNTTFGVLTVVITVAGMATVVTVLRTQMRRVRREIDSHQDPRAIREQIDSILREISVGFDEPKTLDQEMALVSRQLSRTVERMQVLSGKAQAFEQEVWEMVERADAAKAAADLSEDQAKKIGLLLGEVGAQHLREQMEKMASAHASDLTALRREGKITALWTFVGGVLLGVVGNVVVNLIMM